jgi:predicted Zn-dependent protease with MMP-like domain
MKHVSREVFEECVEEALQQLPESFKLKIENVEIIVEDLPSESKARKAKVGSPESLLGLYEGIPLTKRGVWYGSSPVLPDRITLFKVNIERECALEGDLRDKIAEILFHEIGHYFGMSELEIRRAMKDWNTN